MNKNKHLSRSSIVKHVVLVILCIVYIIPLYSLLLSAFRPGRDLLRYGITLKTLIPTGMNFNTIKGLYTIREGIYFTWFENSLLLLVLQTSLALFLSSFVAYGLSLYKFKGRKIVTTLVIFLMLVPIQILILPLYKLMITVN